MVLLTVYHAISDLSPATCNIPGHFVYDPDCTTSG